MVRPRYSRSGLLSQGGGLPPPGESLPGWEEQGPFLLVASGHSAGAGTGPCWEVGWAGASLEEGLRVSKHTGTRNPVCRGGILQWPGGLGLLLCLFVQSLM